MKRLPANLFAGESKVCQQLRSLDWEQTPLVSVEQWSLTLRALVGVLVSSPVPMFMLWGNQQAIIFNEACCDFLETGSADAIGHPANLVLPKLWTTIYPAVSQVTSTGESVSTEPRRWPGCCGSSVDSQLVLVPIYEDSGPESSSPESENSVAGVMGTFTADLSIPQSSSQSDRQLQIDQNLVKESERRSRRIVESNMFGVLYGDIVGGIHYANDYFSSLLGYTDGELTSGDISWDQLTPPEYATLDQQAIEELKEKGVCATYEKVFQHNNAPDRIRRLESHSHIAFDS
ncbi:MAG: PAS domain-containing protein [Cyanobacteria bacterium P01_D01_bin.105]